MPTSFWQSTAEDVVASVEAVVAHGAPSSVSFVSDFADIPNNRAQDALNLAAHLGLLAERVGAYLPASPLCALLATPDSALKAAVIRVVLESYQPFVTFRARLKATDLASNAAGQTRTLLGLTAHRDAIKDTLISLGTYSHALETEGGGSYRSSERPMEDELLKAAQACKDIASAEAAIRHRMGDAAADSVSRPDVLVHLAKALLYASAGDSRMAVVVGGNAIESFLRNVAATHTVALPGATGINAILDKFNSSGALIPKKLIFMGKYLGHVRNAADHGVDPNVNAAWDIQQSTGLEFVYVACSFISAVHAREAKQPYKI